MDERRWVIVSLAILDFVFTFVMRVLLLLIIIPPIYYYFQLPAADSIRPGAEFKTLFSGFETSISTSIDLMPVPPRLRCAVCLPYGSGSEDCKASMSLYLAKKLSNRSNGRVVWMASALILSIVQKHKYDLPAVEPIYFAAISQIFDARNLTEVCQTHFSKKCGEMSAEETWDLAESFRRGSFRTPKVIERVRYEACQNVN